MIKFKKGGEAWAILWRERKIIPVKMLMGDISARLIQIEDVIGQTSHLLKDNLFKTKEEAEQAFLTKIWEKVDDLEAEKRVIESTICSWVGVVQELQEDRPKEKK